MTLLSKTGGVALTDAVCPSPPSPSPFQCMRSVLVCSACFSYAQHLLLSSDNSHVSNAKYLLPLILIIRPSLTLSTYFSHSHTCSSHAHHSCFSPASPIRVLHLGGGTSVSLSTVTFSWQLVIACVPPSHPAYALFVSSRGLLPKTSLCVLRPTFFFWGGASRALACWRSCV